ncbi:DUF4184 family protein [Streptomyces halobius]|uniref:DUF4184 family protein n=1 Tax=Streptomyces halobius TaxID=2879846 RepID=A0ABY4MF96_9ACTN|nr:DUF4184 family protein [Streptomyces halobius]UQA96067.1 DUF4184 family protein [Streptomyces halobius]
MPFTLSHAAAVLPAIRRTGVARGPLVASALVAGSFAPDMTYFAATLVPGAMRFGDVTHGLPGVLTMDVLVTVVLVGGWLLLREPLLALPPRAWQGRAYGFVLGRPWNPRGPRQLATLAGWFYVSAALGSATHVVWDAFTHPGRWGTRLVPGLDDVVGGLPVYTYVQYGTSAVALAGIGWFLWTGLRDAGARGAVGSARDAMGPAPGAVETARGAVDTEAIPALTVRMRLLLTAPVALCVLLGAVHRTLRAYAVYGGMASWFDYVPTVLFGAGAGLTIALPCYAVAVRLLHRRARRPRAAGSGEPGQPAILAPERPRAVSRSGAKSPSGTAAGEGAGPGTATAE